MVSCGVRLKRLDHWLNCFSTAKVLICVAWISRFARAKAHTGRLYFGELEATEASESRKLAQALRSTCLWCRGWRLLINDQVLSGLYLAFWQEVHINSRQESWLPHVVERERGRQLRAEGWPLGKIFLASSPASFKCPRSSSTPLTSHLWKVPSDNKLTSSHTLIAISEGQYHYISRYISSILSVTHVVYKYKYNE